MKCLKKLWMQLLKDTALRTKEQSSSAQCVKKSRTPLKSKGVFLFIEPFRVLQTRALGAENYTTPESPLSRTFLRIFAQIFSSRFVTFVYCNLAIICYTIIKESK